MADKPSDLQHYLLNLCRREGQSVSLYLLKGVRLQGSISGFDNFALTLKRGGEEQLVYKHGIATVAARVALDNLPEVSEGEGLQSSFLDRHVGGDVEAFLVNGVRLGGRLVGHDKFTLLIEGPNESAQLIYKHALSSLSGASN